MLFIFDFDMTIADTYTSIKKFYEKFISSVNGDPSKINYPYLFGLIQDEAIKSVYNSSNPKISLKEFQEQLEAKEQEIILNSPLLSPSSLFKDLTNQGHKIAIVSNNIHKNVSPYLEKYNLAFDKVYLANDLQKEENKSHLITKTYQELSIPQKETIYIGDHPNDLKYSNQAKTKCIIVTTGFHNPSDFKTITPPPLKFIKSLIELKSFTL